MKTKILPRMASFVIGPKLKYLRNKIGMEQKEYSEILDISNSYLNTIESGNKIPSKKVVRKAALHHGLEDKELYEAPKCLVAVKMMVDKHGLAEVKLALEILDKSYAEVDEMLNDTICKD